MKKLLLTLFIATSAFAIYEEDNRKDYYELKDPKLKEITRSIAYQVDKHELRGWTFQRNWGVVTTLFENRDACPGERFLKQPIIRPGCTGVLIGPKLLLTAGNCISEHTCWNDLYYWMFDYKMESADNFSTKRPRETFYKCERIVKRVFDPNNSARSYAILELKKEVKGRTPVKINFKNNLTKETPLVTLGHPMGLPIKIADGVRVFDQNEDFILNNSDIKGQTRGAPIINEKTYELEAMMIFGRKAYDISEEDCWITPYLRDQEAYELAIKPSVFKKFLP